MKKLLFLTAFHLLLSACSKSSFLELFPEGKKFIPELVSLQVDSIYDPYMIECINSKLLLSNLRHDKTLSVFDLNEGKYLGSHFSREGLGNYSFLTNMYNLNNILSFWDSNRSVLTFVNVGNWEIEKEVKISSSASLLSPFQVIPIKRNVFAATGIVKGNRVALLDDNGVEITAFGKYPQERKDKNYTDPEKAFAYQAHTAFHTDKRILVVGAYWGESISFYDLSDVYNPQLIREYVYKFPKYVDSSDSSQSSVVFDKSNISGFIDIKASSDYCVCLYSGDPYQGEYGGDKILIFDWDGKPVELVLLDRKYNNLAINEEKKEIILLGNDNETQDYMIYKIDLPK